MKKVACMEYKKCVLLLGGIIIDRYYEVENYPKSGQDTVILRSYEKVGGCALNVAVTLKNLGLFPYVVSKLGNDYNGRSAMRYIQSLGLSTQCIVVKSSRETGYCLTILEKNGERTFFTSKGCEIEFSESMISKRLFEKTTFAYVTGYYLLNEKNTRGVLEFVKKLKHNGCHILFDPGPLVAHINNSHLLSMIALTDLIAPNRHELELIRNKLAITEKPFRWLYKHGCRYVVVKNGIDGAEVYVFGTKTKTGTFSITPKDTSGAGDSFVGGLIYGLACGLEFQSAIELANACGAYTAMVEGPHCSFSIEDIHAFIDKQIKCLK